MTDASPPTCPLTKDAAIERYFMENRAKLLDLAAFLDRLDRTQAPESSEDDFRVEAMQRAIALLVDEKGDRAKRILELFSDPSTSPIEAAPMKGASGAHKPEAN